MEISSKILRSRGSALLMVIFVVVLLATIVTTTLLVIKNNIEQQQTQLFRAQVEALSNKGLSYGIHPDVSREDPLLSYRSEDGFESYEVLVSSESARLNINSVLKRNDKPLVRKLFVLWGMTFEDAASLVDALADWIDENEDTDLNGAEKPEYEALGFIDRPFNRPFLRIEEMKMVLGIQKLFAVKPDWEEFITIYGAGEIDILEAGTDLLASAAGIDQIQAENFRNMTVGPDKLPGTKDDLKPASIQEALSLMGVSLDQDGIDDILGRFELGSSLKRITCNARVAKTEKDVAMVVDQSKGDPVILFHNVKFSATPLTE